MCITSKENLSNITVDYSIYDSNIVINITNNVALRVIEKKCQFKNLDIRLVEIYYLNYILSNHSSADIKIRMHTGSF